MRIPTRDLVTDLVNHADPFLDDGVNVCRAMPRHLRLYVAGWMLGDGTWQGNAKGLRAALELYRCSGRDLLDRVGTLTTSDIVAEVLQMTAALKEASRACTY